MKINSGKVVMLAICCLCSMQSMKAMDRRTDEIAAWLKDLRSRGIGVPSGVGRSGAVLERPQPAATVETRIASLRPVSYGATDVSVSGDRCRPDPLLRSGWHNNYVGISVAPAASADGWHMSCECCDCSGCLTRCVARFRNCHDGYSSSSWCARAMKHFPFGCALCCCLCMDDNGHAIPIKFFLEPCGCNRGYDRRDISEDQVCEYLTCGGTSLAILATLAMAGVIG